MHNLRSDIFLFLVLPPSPNWLFGFENWILDLGNLQPGSQHTKITINNRDALIFLLCFFFSLITAKALSVRPKTVGTKDDRSTLSGGGEEEEWEEARIACLVNDSWERE